VRGPDPLRGVPGDDAVAITGGGPLAGGRPMVAHRLAGRSSPLARLVFTVSNTDSVHRGVLTRRQGPARCSPSFTMTLKAFGSAKGVTPLSPSRCGDEVRARPCASVGVQVIHAHCIDWAPVGGATNG